MGGSGDGVARAGGLVRRWRGTQGDRDIVYDRWVPPV
jgi:hypothetical protein